MYTKTHSTLLSKDSRRRSRLTYLCDLYYVPREGSQTPRRCSRRPYTPCITSAGRGISLAVRRRRFLSIIGSYTASAGRPEPRDAHRSHRAAAADYAYSPRRPTAADLCACHLCACRAAAADYASPPRPATAADLCPRNRLLSYGPVADDPAL